MNSLENLNNWSNDSLIYGDESPYSITFDAASPTNQSTSVVEDQPFVSPVGINITSMVSTPRNIEFTVDLSSASYAASIDWGQLPYYLTAVVAGTNIFKVVGPITALDWDIIKHPTITILDQATDFTYTSTITYPDPSNTSNDLTKSWTTTVSVISTPNITPASPYSYVINTPGTIAGTPTITNTVAGTYSIIITPSNTAYVYQLSSNGSGGTSVFDPVNKTLTITGTKTQVNSHLALIKFIPSTNINQNFTLEYRLINPTGAQNIRNQYLTGVNPYTISTATYVEDVPFSVGYEILDESITATSFTVSLAQSTPLPSVSPGHFTVNGSNVGNTWSVTSDRTTINSANVVYTPPVDYTGTITFTVNQSKVDDGDTVVQASNESFNIVNVGTNTEIVNMINRSYTSNTVNNIFSTQTPSINDGADVGQTYTITLSSSLGKFGNSAANAIASASYSFTGNMAATNAEFGNMVFVPNNGPASTGTFTYTQTRSGVGQQINVSPSLTGTNGNITPAIYVFTGNATFTPTFDEYYWGNARVMMVGGGGCGGDVSGSVGSGGGGGGGVVNRTFNPTQGNYYFRNGPHTLVIGRGGNTTSRNGTATSISYGGSVIDIANGGQGGNIPNGGNSGGGSSGATGTSLAGGGGGGAGGSGFVGSSGVGGAGGNGRRFELDNNLGTTFPGQTIFGGGGGGGGKGSSGSGVGGSYGGGNAKAANTNATSYGGGGAANNGLGYQGLIQIYIR